MSPAAPDEPELPTARKALLQLFAVRLRVVLIHSLANGIAVISANMDALRLISTEPHILEILDDMAIATERVVKYLEALRRLG